VRVVIADDSLLVREGITALLTRAGIRVVGTASRPDELLREVDAHAPDAAIVDIRMPPTHTDEGLRAAAEIRARHPIVGILIVSQHVEVGVATRLLAESPARLGYLLKERLSSPDEVVAALRRVTDGGSALDPQVVQGLLAGAREDAPLRSLTTREHEVLELVAQGLSNPAIAERLRLALNSVEKHVSSVFAKLGLPATGSEHRRVLAVLRYLRA
jgi:DNA-binding NarL/FixJ family response regulator